MPEVIALTGATGFIGSHVTHRLLEAGHRVKALVRSPQKAQALEESLRKKGLPSRLEWVRGDLDRQEAIETLLHGATRVVHLAGAVRGNWEVFGRVNVKGSLRIFSSWNPRTPLLHISSLAARHPYLSPYATSKRMAEDFLKELKGPWTIFRPPAVYGPGDKELSPLIRLLWRGVVPVFGEKRHRFSIIHVADLAEAVCRWVERPPEQRLYELHDGKPGGYSWEEIAEIAARLRGRPVRYLKVPQTPLRLLGLANLYLARFFGHTPMLTPGKINELFHHDWVCDNTPIETELGFQPHFDLERGLRSLMVKV
ncbi:MAG: NAD-dependent epimerase/dehydratase family protein [Thermodesulfobacteria bacterium]|nr:NAD-dependent epimerase/dehydratase family protein [Thermodesulfobacteriota bacterium]